MTARLMRIALLMAIASACAGCEAEDSQEARAQRQREQYEAMQGSKVLVSAQPLSVFRDKENGVTCWSRYDRDNTLSCLPDWMLKSQEKAQCPKTTSHLTAGDA